jgi:hypothetical protein
VIVEISLDGEKCLELARELRLLAPNFRDESSALLRR